MKFLYRFIAGIVAGIVGSLILLITYLITATYIQPIINPATVTTGETTHPMFTFVFMVMIFIAILATNIVGTWLMGYLIKEKYSRLGESIGKISFLNLMIFVLMIPLYFVIANINLQYLIYAVAVQAFLSGQASILTLETVSNPRYAIVGIYSTTIAILLGGGVLFLINRFAETQTPFLFAIFPCVWVFMGLMHGLIELIYGMIAQASGKDFMAIN